MAGPQYLLLKASTGRCSYLHSGLPGREPPESPLGSSLHRHPHPLSLEPCPSHAPIPLPFSHPWASQPPVMSPSRVPQDGGGSCTGEQRREGRPLPFIAGQQMSTPLSDLNPEHTEQDAGNLPPPCPGYPPQPADLHAGLVPKVWLPELQAPEAIGRYAWSVGWGGLGSSRTTHRHSTPWSHTHRD